MELLDFTRQTGNRTSIYQKFNCWSGVQQLNIFNDKNIFAQLLIMIVRFDFNCSCLQLKQFYLEKLENILQLPIPNERVCYYVHVLSNSKKR